MSGESPDAPARPAREHAGSVLGTAACLLLVPLLLLAILVGQGRALDAAEVWTRVFETAELPAGFELAGASQLPRGDRLAVAERAPAAAGERVPERLCLVLYASPAGLLEAMDRGGPPVEDGRRRGRGGPPGAGGPEGDGAEEDEPITIQRGILEWGGWRADFLHERAPVPAPPGEEGAEGPAAGERPERDTIRVNLSAEGRLCVLFATWPEDVEAEPDWMGDVLRSLRYRASVAAANTSAR